MEHRVHPTLNHGRLGEEKRQMLDLNRRLETYLSRVKLLEEENELLEKEIQALRHSDRDAVAWRRGLEEELQRARLEVDAAWRDRVHTAVEVGRLSEQLWALQQQSLRETQAGAEAEVQLERSRRGLQEEQRAQVWLRERVSQLEQERGHLVQTHQEDVAHMVRHGPRSPAPPTLAQRSVRTPHHLQLGQEISRSAAWAWQEAAEAQQGPLLRLEEALNQTRGRLAQVGRERSESQRKLRALEEEIASAQDRRRHLERTVAQQGQRHDQETQQLQEHLEGLQAEKEELRRQIDGLLQENRGLTQVKTSLGLEVATYRVLLDSERLRGNVSITDAVFNPPGVKKNDQTQLTVSRRTISPPSVRIRAGRAPTAFSATPVRNGKHLRPRETTWERPYPKIMLDGAAEDFRPQEVREKVTYAEPLSPPNGEEALPATPEGEEGEEGEEGGSDADVKPPEEGAVVESGFTTPGLTPSQAVRTREPHGSPEESEDGQPAEQDDPEEPHAPSEARAEEEWKSQDVRAETSDSEPVAMIEADSESWTSSPVSEPEPEERVTDSSRGGNVLTEEAVQETRQQRGTNESGLEDTLYPDGEEMDTWDSVMERKADLNGIEKEDDKRRHAEPEEDLSAREQERERTEIRRDFVTEAPQNDNMADREGDDDEGRRDTSDQAALPDGEGDEDEDSQNLSLSWRTELESDSYAQDNTLADTRPLIRYKSDDADARVDGSESSDGEQERRIGETGTWSEGKSKRFGTMEDLCEDVEEEALDEEYDLGYTGAEDRHVVCAALVSDTEERIGGASEGHLDKEPEELTKAVGSRDVGYDEELETDRLVEQELEDIATEFYGVHFVQEEAGRGEPESSCEGTANQELSSSTAILEQPGENLRFRDSSLIRTDEEVQHQDPDAPGKREDDDEVSVSMVMQADVEEISIPVLQAASDQGNLQDVLASTEEREVLLVEPSQERLTGDDRDCQEVPGTTEWGALENPSKDFETRDQKEEGFPLDEGGSDQDQPLQISPDGPPSENDFFVLKSSTEPPDTTDNGLRGFFSSGVENDFWVSSPETAATFHSDDTAEQINQTH